MKRRSIIGLTITGLVLSVIIGIASLPDEVLIESSSQENSQTQPEDIQFVPTLEESQDFIPNLEAEKNTDNTKAELDALKSEIRELKNEIVELKSASEIPEEIPTISETQEEVSEEQSEGKVIRINLKDGVGTVER